MAELSNMVQPGCGRYPTAIEMSLVCGGSVFL